jgi:urease subunit gamma/beta
MRLTPWEEERLLLFGAAELARRHREAGIALNAPEAVALICDAMLEAARGGSTYPEVEAAGLAAVAASEVMPGVRELVDLVNLEVVLEDGTRLVTLVDPLGRGATHDPHGPGAIVPAPANGRVEKKRERLQLTVRNTSRRVVRVSSHFPFERVNPRLDFDREVARGFRLDLDAGSSARWGPGETQTVQLVRFGGNGKAAPAGGSEA